MPELPELEIVKKSLFKIVNKSNIIDVKIKNKNLRYRIPKIFRKELLNEKIIKISRRSKYLLFHLNKKILLLHFGMTGKLLVLKKNNEMQKTSFYYNLDILHKHNHVYFTLDNGVVLIYNDVRRFGFFKIYKTINLQKIPFIKKLGLEPLSKFFNSKYVEKFIKNKKTKIKNLLMNQTFVSGLGNIYVNEALFMSKIHPLRIARTLDKLELKTLVLNIKSILWLAILKGGSSIKDFKNVSGKSGTFQQFFKVYGMQNKKCSRFSCTGEIKKISISSRSSFFCNSCQR